VPNMNLYELLEKILLALHRIEELLRQKLP
jgi:hypothetical protein